MQEAALISALKAGNLADKTVYMRVNALKRVEKHQGVDLDAEFDRDGMAELLGLFTYTSADEAATRPKGAFS